MGITYEEFDQYIYVTVVVPDGRVIMQRTVYNVTGTATSWEASVSRKSREYRTNEETAKLAIWTKFELECSNEANRLEHVVSDYINKMGRVINIYIVRLSSGTVLRCTRNMDLKLFPLEEIVKKVRKSECSFSLETIQAINFFSKLGGAK